MLSPKNYKYPRGNFHSHQGFSIIELLIVVAIIGILVSIAYPAYNSYQEKRDFINSKNDILAIQKAIDRFYIIKNRFPSSLAEIDMDNLTDPWGSPYFYVNVASYDKKSSHGSDDGDSDDEPDIKVRRDKKLKPVNTDFDLYSAGKDKQTKAAFTAKTSRDDIIRCNNGGYLGYVKDY